VAVGAAHLIEMLPFGLLRGEFLRRMAAGHAGRQSYANKSPAHP
jgi:hypothetical protein